MKKIIATNITIGILILNINAQFPQFRGPKRDCQFPAKGLLTQWPEEGPEQILFVDSLGMGYSSVVYHEGLMYITGKIDTLDYLSALDINGNIKYQIPYGSAWGKGYPDTRSTPTLDNGKLYLVSGEGELVCIDAANGEIIWKVDVDKQYEVEWHRWGVSESPLIVDNLVYCTPGGKITTMVAYNKINGELVWQSDTVSGTRIYASPTLYEYNNTRLIIGLTSHYIFAIHPDNGKIAWKYAFLPNNEKVKKRGANLTNTPIYHENEIFITAGYNMPAVMIKMTEDYDSVYEKYIDTTLDNHHHGVVLIDGYIYGSNWINNRNGNWVCMEWESGKIMYEEKWKGNKGTIIYADGHLYIVDEKTGDIGLVKATPDRFEVISSFKIPEGKGPYWAHPSIYDGKMFIRRGQALMVYQISQ